MGIKIYRNVNVDFSNSRYIMMDVKQYDSKSRYIKVTCHDCGNPVNLNPKNCYAFIRYRKSDSFNVFNTCTILENGQIVFELTEQMLSSVGICYADIMVVDITKSNINNNMTILDENGNIIENNCAILSTMSFFIHVLPMPVDNEEIESTNEFSALNDLIIKATTEYEYIVTTTKEYMDAAKLSADNAKTSETNAKISETNAKTSEDAAKVSETNAKISEDAAKVSETNAKQSEINAKDSEDAAKISETNAKISEDAAKVSETNAKTSEDAARISETNAKDSEDNAEQSETNAKTSEDAAKVSETNAKISEDAAEQSEINAKDSENNAKVSENNAKDSEEAARNEMAMAFNSSLLSKSYANGNTFSLLSDDEWNDLITNFGDYIPEDIRETEAADNAKYYKEQAALHATTATTKSSEAKTSADNAKVSENAAKTSADNAKQSEDNTVVSENKAYEEAIAAYNSALLSKSYTIGESAFLSNELWEKIITDSNEYIPVQNRRNESVENAKYYYEQTKQIANGLNGALLPMGTISFSQLSSQIKNPGYMYNISDDFVSDNTFKDGGNVAYPAGTNVYYTADGYWDCLAKPETYSKSEIDSIVSDIEDNIDYKLQNITLTMQNTIDALTARIVVLENK